MTKVQKNPYPGKALYLIFLLMGMQLSVISQPTETDHAFRMLALGDSYTIGESVELHERWPHQFVARLKEAGLMVQDPDYIATTGWSTSQLLEGISSQLNPSLEYDLVSVLIGVNNQYRGLDPEMYEPELRRIIQHALKAAGGHKSRLIMLSIPDYAYTPFGKGDRKISKELDSYNEIAFEVAQDYGISYFDITPISRKGLSDPVLVAADHLHPSAEQYRAWVDYLWSSKKSGFVDDILDFQEIRRIFYQQEKAWNRGDIDAFMGAYWRSEELQFGGADGITKGWQNTLEKYKSGYPDRAAMGRLSFRIRDISRHSAGVVSLTGSWELQRETDKPGGHFLLIWRKIDGKWKIVVDHTSQKMPQ